MVTAVRPGPTGSPLVFAGDPNNVTPLRSPGASTTSWTVSSNSCSVVMRCWPSMT